MKSSIAIAAIGATASAHMIMTSPQPYGPPPDNSPLEAAGTNYPCKKSGAFTVTQQSKATVGSSVKLAFSGTAVHNGGSCQVSLSKDTAASLSASSQFKVIYSILGGCPGTSGSATSYDVPIPSDVPAGDYTLAWTWFNNVGNREMYMNCAPMTIEGGSGSKESFTTLPDMAVYNIASQNSCKTIESFDVDFPNPGKYITKGATFKAKAPTCDGKASGVGAGGSGSAGSPASGSSGAPAGGSGGNSAASSQAAGAAPSPTQTFDDGQYHPPGASSNPIATGTNKVAVPTATSLEIVPIATTPAASTPVQAPGVAGPSAGFIGQNPNISNGNSSTTGNAPAAAPAAGSDSSAACSGDGTVVCSADGTQFALCNFGAAVFQPVAAGTKCSNGAIMRKRAIKQVRAILWSA